MPPKLVSDDSRHTVIRPLAYVPESDLIAYAKLREFLHHSLQSLRLSRKPEAQRSLAHDPGVGQEAPGPLVECL